MPGIPSFQLQLLVYFALFFSLIAFFILLSYAVAAVPMIMLSWKGPERHTVSILLASGNEFPYSPYETSSSTFQRVH